MIMRSKKKISRFWDNILKVPKIITDEEAKAMEDAVKRIRKENYIENHSE